MPNTEIERAEFRLRLPGNEWTDHSTREAYDFHLGMREQLQIALHMTRKLLTPPEIQAAVLELFRIRLDVIQKHSENSCKFGSPEVKQSPATFDAFVFGQDLRGVLMRLAFFGRPRKILIAGQWSKLWVKMEGKRASGLRPQSGAS